jgi:hypothetical protein
MTCPTLFLHRFARGLFQLRTVPASAVALPIDLRMDRAVSNRLRRQRKQAETRRQETTHGKPVRIYARRNMGPAHICSDTKRPELRAGLGYAGLCLHEITAAIQIKLAMIPVGRPRVEDINSRHGFPSVRRVSLWGRPWGVSKISLLRWRRRQAQRLRHQGIYRRPGVPAPNPAKPPPWNPSPWNPPPTTPPLKPPIGIPVRGLPVDRGNAWKPGDPATG